jgi:O-antigen/teichoic acid export membrane protein
LKDDLKVSVELKDDLKVAASSQKDDMSLTARVSWIMFARTLAFVINFALPLLIVRRLSQADFGLYKQVFLFLGSAMTFLPLGVGMSALYFLPREPQRQPQIVFNILLYYLFISALVCVALVAQPTLLASLFNSAEMMSYAPLVGLLVLTWVVSSFVDTLAVANQELRLATVIVVVTQFTKSLFMVAAVLVFGSVRALLYAALVQGILQTVVLLWYLRSRFDGFWRGFEWSMLRLQLAYALPLGFASMIFQLLIVLDNYFVAHRFGAAPYAIYAVGCFELPLIGILVESVSTITIPHVSYLQKAGDRREIVELIGRVMRKLALILFPLYAFLLVTGREFITFLFTDRYLASWHIFAINITLIPFAVITSAYDPVMRAYAEHRFFLLKVRVALLVLFVLGLWLVVGRFGLVGAIIVNVSVNIADRVLVANKVRGILGTTLRRFVLFEGIGSLTLSVVAASLVAALVRALLVGTKPFFVLAACGASFACVYLAGVLLFRILTLDERQKIWRSLAFWQRFDLRKRVPDHSV